MTVNSNFTSQGRYLLAMWLDDPDAALPITLMQFSDTAREDYAGADTMSAAPCASAQVTSNIDPNDRTLVRYYAGVEFSITVNPGALGKTLKEVGLFIEEGSDPSQNVLMWVGRFPDTLIPEAGQSAATVTLNVTIPVKFENASQIAIVIDNTSIQNQVDNLQEDAGKAAAVINKLNNGTSSTDLPEVTSVNQKADKTALDNLSAVVNDKADKDVVNIMKGTEPAAEKANKTYVDSSFVSLEYMTYSLVDAPMVIQEPVKNTTIQLGSTSLEFLGQTLGESFNVSGWSKLSSVSNAAYSKPIGINAVIMISKRSGLNLWSGHIYLQIVLNPRQDSRFYRALYGTCVCNFLWLRSGGLPEPELKLACDSYSDVVRLFFSVTDDWEVNVDSAWVTFQKQ